MGLRGYNENCIFNRLSSGFSACQDYQFLIDNVDLFIDYILI